MQALLDFANIYVKGLGYNGDSENKENAHIERTKFVAVLKKWAMLHNCHSSLGFFDVEYSFLKARGCEKILFLDELPFDVVVALYKFVKSDPGLRRKRFARAIGSHSGQQVDFFAESLDYNAKRYIKFLDRCINGSIDVVFLNEEISRVKINDETMFIPALKFEASGFPPSPSLRATGSTYCVEDFIFLHSIFSVYNDGLIDNFTKIKRCSHCNCFFFGKTSRAEFCCDKCRYDNHMEKKRMQNE